MSYFRNLLAAVLGRPMVQAAAPPVVMSSQKQQDARNALNRALHDERYEFRTIGALVKAVTIAIGEQKPDVWVEERLREIPARQAGGKPHLWGAVDVVGATVRGYSY